MSVNSEAIRVVIADDEPGMRMIMRKMIEKAEGFTLCGEADNGPDLLKLVERYKPQVCFLDVEMPGMTGLECAKAIQDTDPRTILIFATAHDDYMAQAFEVYAFDYMVKPFKVERVMKTLERIRQVVGGRAQSQSEETGKLEEYLKTIPARGASSGRIMLHHKEGVNFINQSDILLVQRTPIGPEETAGELFDRITDKNLLIRRLNVTATHVIDEASAPSAKRDFEQLDLFTDYAALDAKRKQEDEELAKEKRVQQAMLTIKKKFGKNAILKGMNLEEGATAKDRNAQIGGHKA